MAQGEERKVSFVSTTHFLVNQQSWNCAPSMSKLVGMELIDIEKDHGDWRFTWCREVHLCAKIRGDIAYFCVSFRHLILETWLGGDLDRGIFKISAGDCT